MSLVQAIDKAHSAVQTVYPNAPDKITSISYDQSADEWAKGAYCYFAPGQLKGNYLDSSTIEEYWNYVLFNNMKPRNNAASATLSAAILV